MKNGTTWISVFLKRFIKYFLLLLILIGMTIPLISVASQFATKRILDNSYNQLSKGLSAFENQITKSREVVQALLYEKALIDLLLLEGEPTVAHYMQYNEIQRRLQNFAPSQDYLDYSYIAFEKNPVFISSALASDNYEKIYPSFFEYVDMTPDKWRESLFFGPFDTNFSNNLDYRINDGIQVNSFTYLINMTYYTAIDNSAVFGSVFNTDRLVSELLTKEIRNESVLLLQCENGETLISHHVSSDMPIFEDTVPEEFTIDKTAYKTITMRSNLLGVKAVVGIPADLLFRDFDNLFLVAIIYFVAGLLLIFAFALFFSLREAKMMRNLISMATQTADIFGKSSNEFVYLQNVLQRLGDEDKVKLLRIQQLSFQVVVRMLHQLLLRGVYTEKEADDMCTYFGDRFDRCVVGKLQLLEPQEPQDAAAELESLLHEHLRVAFEWVTLSSNEFAVLLFLSDEETGEAEQAVFSVIAKRLPLKVGFSALCNSIFHVRNAYLQAQTALQQLDKDEFVGVFCPTVATSIPDTALFNKLYDCILYGETDGVEDIFKFIDEKFPPQGLMPSEQQQLYYSLRQSVMAASTETIPSGYAEEDEQVSMLVNPAEGADVFEQIKALNEAALLLCSIINKRKRSGNTELRENILQYLHDNYSDVGLCAAKIAEVFSISEKYVYLFIKEQTGQALGAIIESIRLEEAKKLLKTTNYPNRQIAEMTGFGSENTFYRAFSKYHGVSPAVWRKQ